MQICQTLQHNYISNAAGFSFTKVNVSIANFKNKCLALSRFCHALISQLTGNEASKRRENASKVNNFKKRAGKGGHVVQRLAIQQSNLRIMSSNKNTEILHHFQRHCKLICIYIKYLSYFNIRRNVDKNKQLEQKCRD